MFFVILSVSEKTLLYFEQNNPVLKHHLYKENVLGLFFCVDYCRFKTTSSRPIVCRLRSGGNNGVSSIAIGIVLYFPLIRKLELRQEEYRN
jgi:hypothetical protein